MFGRGKLCPFFFFGGGGGRGGGAPVFLHRFRVWEGETVCVFFFFVWGGGTPVFLQRFSVWEGETVSFFFFGGGV